MKMQAVGLVEVVGSADAIITADQMLKTSEVTYESWNTKCGGHVTIFLSGEVAAVKAAVDSIKENPPCDVVAAAVISNPSEETDRIIKGWKK